MRRDITILVPGAMHERVLARLAENFHVLPLDSNDPSAVTPEIAARVRGLAGGALTIHAGLIDSLPKLEIVAYNGVGYDKVDAKHAATRGVMVTNTPDVLTEEVADTALGLLINTVREFPRAENWLREGRWETEGPYRLTPGTLRGRKVGIFGMGRIGQAIARRIAALDLPVSYHNRRPVEGSPYAYHDTLEGLAGAVDTLIDVAPSTPETEKAVDARIFEALGPSGVFVNIGRGTTMDEPALIEALEKGTIQAAGLDVFEKEPHVPARLLALPNAVLLPHVGSASVWTRNAMADLVVDNLVSWFDAGKALTLVPETRRVKARG
ncbi:MAG: 2-hydroxyacid dehydrogenase [Methylobacterium mesophilicum]|nr:2-hydroxyacid dehydrogenase [Methylobacterium mesophilicum]